MRRAGLVIVSPTVGELRRLGRSRWRIVAFPASVFAVHQLCYLLAYGSHAGTELTEHGDDYVVTAAVVAVALAAISLGLGLLRLLAAWRGHGQPGVASVPLWLTWLGWTLALVAGFCALEGLELIVEPHHAGVVIGIFGNEGWWALPAAAFVGAVMTLFLCGGRALLAIIARDRVTRCPGTALLRHPRRSTRAWRRRPMASCAPGRAPPVVELV